MRRALLSLSFGLLLATSASAQLASQTALVGTVSDPDGLGVPGAQVVAVNIGTRDTYEATTGAEGHYTIQFVRTGVYDITVTLTGFQTSKVTGVEVANNQVVRTNVVMKVGQLNESITVVASSPILDTDSARISETIGKRAVSDLPLNGRNVWSLASTTPGVLGGLNSDIGLSFRGAGQREIQNSLSLDGINSSANLLAATSMRPIADAVDGDSDSDRQHVGRVWLVSRRPHQRGDQERHESTRMARSSSSSRTMRSTSADTSTIRRFPRIRGSATSSASRWTGRSCSRSSSTAATRRSSWRRTKASARTRC